MELTKEELVKKIDQSRLESCITYKEVEDFINEAKKYGFGAVAVLPIHVAVAKRLLKGSGIKVDAAIGFPLGSLPTELKVSEVEWCLENGADEFDMVMNICALKSGEFDLVKKDIEEVVKAAKGRIVKVIIEVPLLTKDEIAVACNLIKEAGAHFVKTSTGFKTLKGWRATTVEDVKFLKQLVGTSIKVKASGGMHSTELAVACLKAGAERIGTISGVEIVEGLQ